MKLSVAVLMLLMLGALGEVVKDFTTCNQFFLDNEPQDFDIKDTKVKMICQKYKNAYHYATLYDTGRKIPVYSAYQYKRGTNCTVRRPKITWMIEPQLEDSMKSSEMALQSTVSRFPKNIKNQAINSEYENSRYDKGHLFPFCHADSDDTAESTFTLTNAAPQRCDFNTFWYSKVEGKVRDALNKCLNKSLNAYVVTGVVPSKGPKLKSIGNGVNVPSHFWTAYSCCDNNNNCTFGGYTMEQEADEPKGYNTGNIVQFHKDLSVLYGVKIEVFDEALLPSPGPSKKPRTG